MCEDKPQRSPNLLRPLTIPFTKAFVIFVLASLMLTVSTENPVQADGENTATQ